MAFLIFARHKKLGALSVNAKSGHPGEALASSCLLVLISQPPAAFVAAPLGPPKLK